MRERLSARSPAGRRMAGAVPLSLLAHAVLAGGLVAWAWRDPAALHPLPPDEAPQVELVIGTGGQTDGTPPPPPPTPVAEAARLADPPAPAAPPQPRQDSQATPPPPAPPAPQAAPAARPAPPVIRLGEGAAPPPAENPIGFAPAGPDAKNTAPEYPIDAARRREEGVVDLALHIDETGRVVAIEILRSSGSPRLDDAARKKLATWHFRPAFREGQAVPTVVEQIIEFKI